MPKKKKYGNILDKPISITYLQKSTLQAQKEYSKEVITREESLFEHYGLTRPKNLPISAQKLIRAMARELKINGFFYETEIKTAGRPKIWAKTNDKILLFFIVQGVKEKHPDKTLFDIITTVVKKYYPKTTARSLYSRYNEIMKSEEIAFVSTLIKQNGVPDNFWKWCFAVRKNQL